MKKDIKLTIWGATLFLSGVILFSGGIYIGTGMVFLMIGSIIGILSLSHKNVE